MKRISAKIFIGYLIMILLLSGLILFFSFQTIKSHYIKYLINDLKNYNEVLLTTVKPYISEHKIQGLDSLIKDAAKEINTRITIMDENGAVLADSKNQPAKMENHSTRPEILQAKTEKLGVSLRFSSTVGKDMLYVAIPINIKSERKGYIRLSLFINDINNLIEELETKIIQITLLVVFISLIAIYFFSGHISAPLNKLAQAAKRVASGDFKTRVYLKNRDEMKDLAESFNYMTEHISYLFNQLTNEKEKLDGLIKSLHEGFIVIDDKGELILANEAFCAICGADKAIGRYYWEMIQNHDFSDFIKSVQESHENVSREIVINDNSFLCSANYLEGRNQRVVIMHDVTKNKQLEKMKKDFIVNVSHELRTPLTAIKGFVETMEDDANEEQLHYLEIIHRHSNRLINIVNDLLSLSDLEQEGAKPEYGSVKLEPYLKNLAPLFDHKLDGKNLELIIDVKPGINEIEADSFKLEQIFVNLIDNAIKYTDEGYVKVSVTKETIKDIDYARIEIADTGLGISKEQQERIFERFYVADKSRSRKVGGTGLGLSIVKHIALLHKGEIKVESERGKGAKFIVYLPIKAPF
jgi:two-component system phosphate regulon sensor histidine kinase PhoR